MKLIDTTEKFKSVVQEGEIKNLFIKGLTIGSSELFTWGNRLYDDPEVRDVIFKDCKFHTRAMEHITVLSHSGIQFLQCNFRNVDLFINPGGSYNSYSDNGYIRFEGCKSDSTIEYKPEINDKASQFYIGNSYIMRLAVGIARNDSEISIINSNIKNLRLIPSELRSVINIRSNSLNFVESKIDELMVLEDADIGLINKHGTSRKSLFLDQVNKIRCSGRFVRCDFSDLDFTNVEIPRKKVVMLLCNVNNLDLSNKREELSNVTTFELENCKGVENIILPEGFSVERYGSPYYIVKDRR